MSDIGVLDGLITGCFEAFGNLRGGSTLCLVWGWGSLESISLSTVNSGTYPQSPPRLHRQREKFSLFRCLSLYG
ncbi:hypothetical protein M011DRAFT_270778 [Sporormia fimetaria CBS 119925]|uniref:Uncharacterized protein n=1 Tax=Sporormia fimetaria CBS 119925 TaxID=1340428 RepID=A0A6A6UW07_9PLEO|nr:hypothetical protein M011DRAFT_270778 [Sporormia fimetaria CBS 119925]